MGYGGAALMPDLLTLQAAVPTCRQMWKAIELCAAAMAYRPDTNMWVCPRCSSRTSGERVGARVSGRMFFEGAS